jgi:hypothetical protein
MLSTNAKEIAMAAPSNTDEAHDFADIIKEFAHGSTNKVLTERLKEIVNACRETGAKGAITLKLSVDIKQGIAELKAAISVKKPEPALPGQHFYATDGGELVDEDPRQLKPPSKILDVTTKLKTIDGGNAQ